MTWTSSCSHEELVAAKWSRYERIDKFSQPLSELYKVKLLMINDNKASTVIECTREMYHISELFSKAKLITPWTVTAYPTPLNKSYLYAHSGPNNVIKGWSSNYIET